MAKIIYKEGCKDVDNLAKSIKGTDLLKNFNSYLWSCSRACTQLVGLLREIVID